MILLIDIGNTRIKWAWFDGGVLGALQAAVHSGWTRQDVTEHVLQSAVRPERVLIANVSGAQMGEPVRDAVMSLWNLAPEFIKTTASAGGVRNAYPIPEQHGVDRWLGIIAARASYPGLVCVANVGTAMTIDAVDATGQHLGGLIVPGPDLMIGSLLRNTSDIAIHAQRREPEAGGMRGASQAQGLFADSTLEGVRLGAVHALAALIDRSVESLRRSYQEPPTLLLSGGANERVAGCLLSSFTTVPDLVLRGLVVLANAPRG